MRALASCLLLCTLAACSDDNTYKLTYACGQAIGYCQLGQACPSVPLKTGGCEDLPEMLGHPAILVDAGVVPGCRVALPYGNPARGGDQVICDCRTGGDAGAAAAWICP